MAPNPAKYLSYTETWRRINSGLDSGAFFEVVTLCESIISDRLLSFVRGVDPSSKANVHTPFSQLIACWRKSARTLPPYDGEDLGAAVDSWRKERNEVVHGLAKSMPGTPTDGVVPYIQRAERAARRGVSLARAVSAWHKKQLAAHLANYSLKRTNQSLRD